MLSSRASGAVGPRERLLAYGTRSLSTAELLGILLWHGCKRDAALSTGHLMVAQFGLSGIARASVKELMNVSGCGPSKAVLIKAAIELGRRLTVGAADGQPLINTPQDAADLLSPEMSWLEQEHLRVVLLSTKNHLLAVHEIYKGSLNSSQVRIAELFREAVRSNCAALILAHNHPSGDPLPSAEDVHVTRQVVEAGRLLDIDVLDHIIIGRKSWVSLRERGLGFG